MNTNYNNKYLKYKLKYFKLKNLLEGGAQKEEEAATAWDNLLKAAQEETEARKEEARRADIDEDKIKRQKVDVEEKQVKAARQEDDTSGASSTGKP